MPWTSSELERFAAANVCRIAPYRADGKTPGTPTFIWSVVAGDALYVRAYSGFTSRWYQAAIAQRAGELELAGEVHQVSFEPVSGAVNDDIDASYRAKYTSSRYLGAMVSERARAATVRVQPRG